jgi:membrane peptidoglycan carboxypeptidase
MTLKFRFPRLVAFVISAFLLLAVTSSAHAASKSAKKPAAKKASASKSAAKGRREAASTARKGRGSKSERAASKGRGRNDRRASRSERAAERRGRRGRNDARAEKISRKDWKHMSKRERMIAARAEAERRRREAAERARQLAIYLARIRAQDQALRDETAANIAKDETTGEDLDVRRVAMNALAGRSGTVVVMNPKTGQVYTVVNQDWALRHGFKPCSTTKIVTGLAGLTENVIDPAQTVNIGTSSYRLDLTDALAYSDNGYFQRVGGQVGFDKMMEYAHKLGLGEQTGINHPFESPGRLPSFKQGYAVNHMSSHGDDIEVTAIQLANLTSAIANGGHLLVPHLPRTPEENVVFKRVVKRDIDIPQSSVQRLIPGMIGSVNYGSGKRAYNPTETIAGKTGTCTGQGSKLGLFTSFAPVHDPQLAITVITRGSTSAGYRDASTIAGQIYSGLRSRFGPRPGSQPLLANDPLVPRPHIDPRKAAELNGEEKDDAADDAAKDAFVVSEAGDSATQPTATQNNAAQPALQKTAKTIERPAASAPVKPSATPTPTTEQKSNNGTERPRRVSDKPE